MSTGRHPTRRDFLQGRAAAEAIANAVIGPDTEAAGASSAAILGAVSTERLANFVASIRRPAMACEFEVQLAAGRQDTTEHVLAALDLVEQLEEQLTIYRADSEVLRINRSAGLGPVVVEPRLFALFQAAERHFHETDGAFDITSGPLSEVWGFSRRQGRMPEAREISAALDRVGMDGVEFNAINSSVAFRRPGVTLHLNSMGKGYALDRMAELLDAKLVGDYLLQGGRSSVLARGNCPHGDRPGWTIGVPHPLRPGERLSEVRLINQALGTSGSGTQFFEHEGRRYGHLLDPRTGQPVEGIYSATVIAPTAAEADALSTAFYVMGPASVGEYCAHRPEISAILSCPGEQAGDVVLWRFGRPTDPS